MWQGPHSWRLARRHPSFSPLWLVSRSRVTWVLVPSLGMFHGLHDLWAIVFLLGPPKRDLGTRSASPYHCDPYIHITLLSKSQQYRSIPICVFQTYVIKSEWVLFIEKLLALLSIVRVDCRKTRFVGLSYQWSLCSKQSYSNRSFKKFLKYIYIKLFFWVGVSFKIFHWWTSMILSHRQNLEFVSVSLMLNSELPLAVLFIRWISRSYNINNVAQLQAQEPTVQTCCTESTHNLTKNRNLEKLTCSSQSACKICWIFVVVVFQERSVQLVGHYRTNSCFGRKGTTIHVWVSIRRYV